MPDAEDEILYAFYPPPYLPGSAHPVPDDEDED